jgi:hypothetical protein
LFFFIGAAVGAVAASSALGPRTSGVARLLAAMTALFLASVWIVCIANNSVIQS